MQETTVITETFKEEIDRGLSSDPKYIPSKYFYDDEGSRLFASIMRMPEYYLTTCEYEIFREHSNDMINDIFKEENKLDLVELGAGDGLKTSLLIQNFINHGINFKYIPVDISEEAISTLVGKLRNKFPELKIAELKGDYFKVLHDLNFCDACKKVVLFLGSNIGNFSNSEAIGFYNHLSSSLKTGDLVLTGFDMVKDPKLILNAYNDKEGITRDFNLNLLHRLNRELDANFVPDNFIHYPVYDPVEKSAKSYLVSTLKQTVNIGALEKTFHFDRWEGIHTEMSRKFTTRDIQKLSESSGYRIVKNFWDSKGYFVNSLWEKN